VLWGAIAFGFVGPHHCLSNACGQENKTTDTRPTGDYAGQFFASHCESCHSKSEPEGDFDLKSLSAGFDDKDARTKWLAALEQITAGNMPPIEQPRLSQKEIAALTAWINQRVAKAEEIERSAQGRVVLRRLNRNEFVNTLRDLLGVQVKVDDLFPPSTSTSGFDNSASSLHISTYLLENYLAAADRALDEAIANGPRPDTIKQRHDIRDETTVKPTGSVYRHLDDGVAIFSTAVNANIQVTLWRFNTRSPGKYRFRISGYAFQTDEPVTFHVNAGPMNAAAQQYLIDYFEMLPLKPNGSEPTVVEFTDQMEAIQTIRIVADGLKIKPWDLEKIGVENYKGPGMVVQWVEVEGPMIDQWPPKSHQQIFGDMQQERDPNNRNRREVVSQQPLVDAERILREFTRRAFRRPVSNHDIKPFMDRVQAKLEEDYSFEQAVRVGLKAVMVSPEFLFLREQPTDSAQGMLLDDFALASRLSYFLWSSMPDEALFTLAQEQQLHQPETLREQVERMLRDSKSAAFTENFVGQWLALRSIDDTMPDELLYPEFDDLLKESMVKEVTMFFDEVLKNDLSLMNFVASDFTMINSRLAQHYGIEGVEGIEFRKVAVPENSHRGGVLTMSAVLKVTANGTTTSPILRGAWVLDRILGTPPPKPTVDVEAIEPDIRGATTIRDQLAKHREVPACAICHVRIDPPGFALENFDVIGGWRANYRSIGKGEPAFVDGQRMRYLNGPIVDASDVLPDGRKFQDIDEFKQWLLDDKDQIARSLAGKLVAYATGAAPATADQTEIESIVARTREKNYGFRSLVHEVVQSQIFRHK
jgi:transcriptional regulator NrdR family protein